MTQHTLLVSTAPLSRVEGQRTLVIEHRPYCSSPRIPLRVSIAHLRHLLTIVADATCVARVQLKLSACFSSGSPGMVPYS